MEPNKTMDASIIPKITDVEWNLEVLTNTPGVGSDNLLYTVILKTDIGDDIKFTAGSQQLQDLVYKLKDLVRHCDRVKNELIWLFIYIVHNVWVLSQLLYKDDILNSIVVCFILHLVEFH